MSIYVCQRHFDCTRHAICLPQFQRIRQWLETAVAGRDRFRRVLTYSMSHDPVPEGAACVIQQYKSYKCEECGPAFATTTGLKFHAMTIHGARRQEGQFVEKIDENASGCQCCRMKYARFDLAQKHLIDSCKWHKKHPKKQNEEATNGGEDDSGGVNENVESALESMVKTRPVQRVQSHSSIREHRMMIRKSLVRKCPGNTDRIYHGSNGRTARMAAETKPIAKWTVTWRSEAGRWT